MIFFPIRKCFPEVGKTSNVSNDIDYYSCDNIGYYVILFGCHSPVQSAFINEKIYS